MNYVIHPLSGVNDITFGMPQHQVLEHLPGGDLVEVRNESPQFLTYSIEEGSDAAFFYFDSEGRLKEIEFSSNVDVSLGKIQLGLNQVMSKVLGRLEEEGYTIVTVSPDLKKIEDKGITFWIEHPEEDKIGSILVSSEKG